MSRRKKRILKHLISNKINKVEDVTSFRSDYKSYSASRWIFIDLPQYTTVK